MQGQYNLRSPAVKRLMKEAQELREPTEQFYAQPLEDNLFEWHFTIRGPVESEFEGGIYHGRIILPPEYPMKPPSIILLTPNGRFEIFKKICLSISGHHPESWQPSWSIRTALLAIIGFMPTHGHGAIGSLDYTPDERKILARKSLEWKCPNCGSVRNALKPVTEASKKDQEEAKELATQIDFQGEKEKKSSASKSKEKESPEEQSSTAEAEATANTTPADLPNAVANAAFNPGSYPMMPPGMPMFMPPFPPRPPGQDNNARPQGVYPSFWQPHNVLVGNLGPNQRRFPLCPPQLFHNPVEFLKAQANLQQAQALNNGATNKETTTVTSTSTVTSQPIPSTSQNTGQTSSQTRPMSENPGDNSQSNVPPADVPSAPASPELRQRNVPQAQAAPEPNAQPAQNNVQYADLPAQQNRTSLMAYLRSENPFILLLMLVLALAIAVLVARRIFMMHVWKFNADYNI